MERHFFRAAGIIVTCLFLPVLFYLPVEAREGRASLVFQKTSAPPKTNVYVVKKGDILAGIFLKQPGNQRVPYNLIRRLNPGIRNLNRIYPGQKIVLPVRETLELSELPSDVHKKSDFPSSGDRIKEEDRAPAVESFPPSAGPAENAPPETTIKTPPAIEHILGFIRPVVSRMNGTLIAKGNYFIPLKEAAQITIDCSLIPVIELDEGTTVLLDFGNRLSEEVKALIGQSWTNYAFVPGEELTDGLRGLKGIIRRSRNYEMSEVGSPFVLLPKPEIRVFPDWAIAAKKTSANATYRQGLFLLGSNEKPFAGEARSFLEKNGLVVTEISGNRAVTGPSIQKAAPTPTDLSGLKGIVLAELLLKTLGETPVAGIEVVLFDQAKSGFNLSITADLLLRRGEKRFVIHTKRLPEQFVHILKEGGAEVVQIAEDASGRPLIEGLLQALQIPVSFGYFAFRIPEVGNRTRLTATFPALRAMSGDEPLYLIDFDAPPDVLAFLNGLIGGRIAKY
jgi:LysM repeat protein